MLELITLGGASIRREGRELRLTAHRQKLAVLVHLALEGPLPRDRLLRVFWGDRSEDRARHSLSQVLYAVKQELGEGGIVAVGDQIGFEASGSRIDVQRFESAVDAGDWDEALEIYGGPFLDGFHLPEAPEFEDWLAHTRARLARSARRAFAGAIAARLAADDPAGALSVAWRWAGLEPLEDEAQHTLIALLARSGNRSAALKQYEAYRDRLAQELGVEPLQATIDLVDRVRGGRPIGAASLGARPGEAGRARASGAEVGADPEEPVPDAAGTAEAAVERTGPDGSDATAPMWMRLVDELRGRRVFHVGVLYVGFGWAAVEVADVFVDRAIVPEWVFNALLLFLLTGFPVALLLAWAQAPKRTASGSPDPLSSIDWPDWMERIRGVHVLLILGFAIIGLLASLAFLERGGGPAARAAGTDLSPARIGVLPFMDESRGGDLGYLADGLTRSLTERLGALGTLEVLPSRALQPHAEPVALDSIVRKLRLGTIVHGSVSGAEDRVRVTVELIRGSDLVHLEAARLDGTAGDPLALVDELSEEVSRLLRRRLGVEIRTHRWRAETADAEAWKLAQFGERMRSEAQTLWQRGDTLAAAGALARADSLLGEAERRDARWTRPTLLRGWVAADRANLFGPRYGVYDQEAAAAAIAQAERVLQKAPADPGALELRGVARFYLSEIAAAPAVDTLRAAAERDLRAVAFDPSRVRALATLSRILHNTGRFQEARVTAERALEADYFLEEARQVVFRLCYLSIELKDWEDARKWCDEGRRRFPDHAGFMEAELALLASSVGPAPVPEKAWQLYHTWLEGQPPQRREAEAAVGLMYVAAVLARAELRDSAAAVIALARASAVEPDPLLDYYEANARLHMKDREAALRLLESFLAAEPSEREYIAEDHWWESLHDEPRFRALIAGGR